MRYEKNFAQRERDGLDIASSASHGPRPLHHLRSIHPRRRRRDVSAGAGAHRSPSLLRARRRARAHRGRRAGARRLTLVPPAPPRARARARAGRGLGGARAQPLHQRLVRLGLDDLVELRAVVRHEADTLDDHVVGAPPTVGEAQAVIDGHLGALLRRDQRLDRGLVTLDGLARVDDLLALIEVDLRHVRAVEEIGEQAREVLALLRRARVPVRAQRPARRIGVIEHVFRDLTDLGAALVGPRLQPGIVEDLDDGVDVLLQLLRRRSGACRYGADDQETECDQDCKGGAMWITHGREDCNGGASGLRSSYSRGMRYGFYLPTRGPCAEPEALDALVERAERLGFHSTVVADHVVFPATIASKYPYTVIGVFPGGGDALEQLTLVAFVAARSRTLRLVTSVMILPHRHPVLAAKMLATIDVLSGGRLIVGVGVGWLREEFRALGAPDFDRRGAASDEILRIFKTLWTQCP